MWRRTIAALAVATTTIVLGGPVPAARAAGPGEPIFGDLNADRLLDRVRLGTAPGACVVVVEAGRPGGGYLPPQRRTYRVPAGVGSARCPDLGVAVDLDAAAPPTPGSAELVLGWYAGPLRRTDYDLLVLRDYLVADLVPALDRPTYLGLADFNGDRRLDVYVWTDQGEGFASYLNPGSGTLVPGPVRYCAGRIQYRFADFDADGATDLAAAYADRCDDGSNGVAVVLDDGTVVELRNQDGASWWIHVLYADRNGTRDILAYQLPTGRPSTFLGRGDGSFLTSPVANGDRATVAVGSSVRIPVLRNDWVSRRATVSVSTPPLNGTVQVFGDRYLRYRPGPAGGSTDRFSYRITQDGRTSEATVLVVVTP